MLYLLSILQETTLRYELVEYSEHYTPKPYALSSLAEALNEYDIEERFEVHSTEFRSP